MCNCSPEVLRIVPMAETSGDSIPGVSGIIFEGIQELFTTRGSSAYWTCWLDFGLTAA
jgi:hypothetical protein